ncbi:MAG TPA: hypothetical protein VFL82_03510 [Thermomicrobiales bacterium]|nr:hypothetical protein [Thermomicrobiales bacterium]
MPGVIRFQPAATPREDSTTAAFSSAAPLDGDDQITPSHDPVAPSPRDDLGPLTVRGLRARDLPGVRQASAVLRLHQPEINVRPYSPLRSALGTLAPGRQMKPRMFVARAGNDFIGFAHFQQALPDNRWQLIAAGTASGDYDAAPVWEDLLEEAVIAAGLRGVKRLYAKAPHGWPIAEALRAVGFAPYATETVYLAQQIRLGPVVEPVRQQNQADTWAIHQLYNVAVPREVQYAEAYTSHRWDVRGRSDRLTGLMARGWLIEDGHHVLGYVRVLSAGSTHIIEVLVDPERREVIEPLLDGALNRIVQGGHTHELYAVIRGYQTEIGSLLEQRGFAPVVEQDLHLKYTTATVRAPATETVVFHPEVIEKLPKRVPSFLHGTPRDESAH